jgi:hypothetical protein
MKLGELRDPLRLPIAQRDAVHQRMALEQLCEARAETAQTDKPDADSHDKFLP